MNTFDGRSDSQPSHDRRAVDTNHGPDITPVTSGYYRVRDRTQPTKSADELARMRSSVVPLAPVRPSAARRLLDPLHAWLPALLFVPPACQWLAHTELALCLLALSPVLLIALKPSAVVGSVYAGLSTVLLMAADQLHPLRTLESLNHTTDIAPHKLLSLAIISFVLFRLRDAYFGLKQVSQHDPLTGLLNRRGFEELAHRELGRAARYRRPIAFAVVDIDRFKDINDTFGHAYGDNVLRVVGAALARLRASDLAVRLGGDEFGLLMPETDAAAAARVVSRLKHCVQEHMRALGWPVTISVGAAASDQPIGRLADLMAEADRRMYLDKPRDRSVRPVPTGMATRHRVPD